MGALLFDSFPFLFVGDSFFHALLAFSPTGFFSFCYSSVAVSLAFYLGARSQGKR